MSNEDLLLTLQTLGDDQIRISNVAQRIIREHLRGDGSLNTDLFHYLDSFLPGWWEFRRPCVAV